MEKIVIGSDHGGFKLKEKLKGFLGGLGYEIKDVGCFNKESCDYPKFAYRAAREVSVGKFTKGILICKSGIGNSIAANKLKGVRAALCYNLKAAKLSRLHNDANLLVLGALFVNPALAKRMARIWLNTEFEGGRHSRRLKQIKKIEDMTNNII
jgi:ribose 5-phosphate isomerase B